jgi:hypothetical protein
VALQQRGDHGDQGVVHHPIAEGSGTHHPRLGFTDREEAEGSGA